MIDRINRKYFLLAIAGAYKSKETDVDIAVRCPICGDSAKKKRSTRLHLYHKGGSDFIGCFNAGCAAENKNTYSFLRDFFPGLLESYKREQFSDNLEKATKEYGGDVFSKFKNTHKEHQKEELNEVLTHDLTSLIQDICEVPEAIKYLESRGFNYTEKQFGKWYWGYQNLRIGKTIYKITDAIIIPLYYNGAMYGFYSRNIHDKTFYTYNPEANIGFKVWNWFNVNKDEPVYIYEGIFDAISGGIPNSVALMGAKIPEDRLAELKDPVFVLDNDSSGFKNSLIYCKDYVVYIQPDLHPEKDMNELMTNNPYMDIPALIQRNLFHGISAIVRLQQKM